MKHPSVKDYMTTDVVTLRSDAGFKEIVRTLAERGVSGAPVVNEMGHVIGMVSEADLLHKEEFATVADEPRRYFESRRARAARAKAAADTASELMSSPAVTVPPDTSMPQAARIMGTRQVKRLPVVDADGLVVGIISRADVMGVFLAPDHQIRERVITEVIERSLWEDPARVNVGVTDGVVTLSGTLEQKSLIPIAVKLTRALDGVVDVVAHDLTYAVDDTPRDGRTY
ncbi:CBS domain-containing protein [Actinomadura sp. HBU206391]|uniref:CBS domain-containing protein n=1 Tax=Actinomadura sp. HBU206391 TaxID=2731692 RepID=UPI00165073E9|nr:CBS domain-containing protein [Actinomadura sp. HBU206391]MBC6461810.1 CBS domain-containing protein [Actinomadura sp. HBU206391]